MSGPDPRGLPMPDEQLDQIAGRVLLWAGYGDWYAANPADAVALLDEVRRARAQVEHLIRAQAMTAHALESARARVAEFETGAAPLGWFAPRPGAAP